MRFQEIWRFSPFKTKRVDLIEFLEVDTRILVQSSECSQLKVLDLSLREIRHTFDNISDVYTQFLFHEDFIYASTSKSLFKIRISSKLKVETEKKEAHEEKINQISFVSIRQKEYLCSCSDDKTFKLWDT